ncbi:MULTISPECIES: hypothetical protein [Sphingobacterium]|uniref:hypothetical protein n=1 Tax=Sphingobacterium TaxID=28453 RepID=UPI00104C1A1D|nr:MULTISPECIES: hypothetical protein [Sphingobacterium]MCW2259458.1 hypothetical protein [Sphingobacterium kitahiroshimense]TCR14095.1 hypothetical protein EDF67_101198 [Sphingobacterium sp. JUb78]
MKKIIQKISAALQVVLLAPIKLPGKALNIIKYIALGLGVVETVLDDKDKKGEEESPPPEQILRNKEREVRDERQ